MKRPELLARLLVILAVLGAVALPFVAQARAQLVHARMPEAGGWSPDLLRARVGEPLHLRLTSDDVVHGFAVGGMDMQSVDVMPGQVTDLTLVFDRPGTYTFYCTRWCGINHWRMRGTIEVSADSAATPEPASRPLYVALGLDIDAPHLAPSLPAGKPSAIRAEILASIPELTGLLDLQSYRSQSPYAVWQELRSDPSLAAFTDRQLWDMVAWLWRSQATDEALARGRELFARNCAACHGETGAGDGVFADGLASQGSISGDGSMSFQRPADLADPARMLGASPAVLQGKILRGGMGTGMPMWGSIFTEDQIWDLVAYLYSFQFEYR